MVHNGVPETVTIDQSGANLAALKAINIEREPRSGFVKESI
jgi:hypothetical protein